MQILNISVDQRPAKTVTSKPYHKSFYIWLYGLMCGGAFGYQGRTSGFRWEVEPALPKDAETILTYKWSIAVKDIGDLIAT